MDVSFFTQILQRTGDRSGLNLQSLGDLFGAGDLLGALQVEDDLQIIFQAFGQPAVPAAPLEIGENPTDTAIP